MAHNSKNFHPSPVSSNGESFGLSSVLIRFTVKILEPKQFFGHAGSKVKSYPIRVEKELCMGPGLPF